MVFQIALWSDLWKSVAVNVVFKIASWSDLSQSAAAIRTHDDEGNMVFQKAVWSDLWQSAAAINVSATRMYNCKYS